MGIVEDDASRMAVAGAHPAHAMAQMDPRSAARSPHGPVIHRKDDAVALIEVDDLGSRLHPWPLLGQHEFATRKVPAPKAEP